MTFEEFTAQQIAAGKFTPKPDPWDPCRSPRSIKGLRFARVIGPSRGRGRIVQVTQELADGLFVAHTIGGKCIRSLYHEYELAFEGR